MSVKRSSGDGEAAWHFVRFRLVKKGDVGEWSWVVSMLVVSRLR
jgi:hypothetical protein